MIFTPKLKNKNDLSRLNRYLMFALNQLMDAFVDHYLIDYNFYNENWHKTKKELLRKNLNFDSSPLHITFSFYILHYLDYNYIFTETARLDNLIEINNRTENIEQKLLKSSRINLDSLKNELDRFNHIKSSTEAKKILSYMYGVLEESHIWSEKHLNEQFRIRFNNNF